MSKPKKIGLTILIIIGGWFVLSSLSFFMAPGFLGMLVEGLGDKMSGSQTVGQVTVNRSGSRLSIIEVTEPEWNPDAISQVIGKAYKIERVKDDNKPVRVEFSYDPAELGDGVPESSLRLFKWHSNGEYSFWSMIPSRVDISQHIVTAELTSFSILAVRAPLAYYLSSGEVAEINSDLQSLMEDVHDNTCGLIIYVDEELLEFKDGELMEAYLRPFDEREEYRDCIKNPSAPDFSPQYSIVLDREHTWNKQQTRNTSYAIKAYAIWQIDHEESVEIKGTIFNQKNKPLEGVKIIASKQKYNSGKKEAMTDKDGKFELALHSGEYKLDIDPGSENKNCAGTNFTEKFFEFGKLPENLPKAGGTPYKHGPWEKTITLKCSEYYLDETLQLPIDANVSGLSVKGTETAIVTGQLIQPFSGGYGWEGVWEIDYLAKTDTKTTGVLSIMGGTISMPPASNQAQDHFKYRITLPKGAKVGNTFSIVGSRAGEGYKDSVQTSAGTLGVTAKGATASFNLGSSSGGQNGAGNVAINQVGKIISVDGENGLTIELFPMMANDLPRVSIKHQVD